jgi:hypothetical protein
MAGAYSCSCVAFLLAGPSDVLVSSALRDLVIGSGLEFDDRGAHTLKGVLGRVASVCRRVSVVVGVGEAHPPAVSGLCMRWYRLREEHTGHCPNWSRPELVAELLATRAQKLATA